MLFAVALFRFGRALSGGGINETHLNCVITIFDSGFTLYDHAGARLNYSNRHDLPLLIEYLGHPQFLAYDSVSHCCHPSPYRLPWRLNTLISTSTPAGKSRRISVSTVFCVGLRISSSLLWVRISN